MTRGTTGLHDFHGELALSILLALYDGPGYGLELARRIEARTDLRFGTKKVWPTLRRLRDRGEVAKREVTVQGDGPHGCVQQRQAVEWSLTQAGVKKVERVLARVAALLGGDCLVVTRNIRARLRFPIASILGARAVGR